MKKNYNENLVAGAAIRDDKGRRISKLFEGSHPKMTVGYAKNLIMPDDPTEQEFNFRQSGGGVIEDGVAVIDKVKGNSVVWNQAFNRGSIFKLDGLNVTYNQTTKFYDCRGNNTESQIRAVGIYSAYFKSGDIIMRIAITKNFNVKNVDANEISCVNFWNLTQNKTGGRLIYNKQGLLSVAISEVIGDNGDRYFCYYDVDTSIALREETDTLSVSYAVYNLTQMFGAGNEPTTYEEFLQRKPKIADEFAYNEGTIVNNKVEKVKVTGVNLWDEQWELGAIAWSGVDVVNNTRIRSSFVPIFANTTYYLKCGSVRYEVFFYDANKSHISHLPLSLANGTLTTPNGAVYLRFTTNSSYTETTYNHDICINLSDPAINGKYFPYEKHELDLSWVKEIRDAEGVKLFEDGMRSAGTAFDEVAKGKAIKRIGVVNLGNLNWEPGVQTGQYKSSDFKQLRPSAHKSLVCANYTTREDGGNMQNDSKDLWVWNNVGGGSGYYPEVLVAKDTRYSSAQAFKQAVQGVLLYYELAEPIEVEYDEKNLTYPVVAGGTEEAIASEPSSAFRADTGYGIDAVKTILDLKARVEALEGK